MDHKKVAFCLLHTEFCIYQALLLVQIYRGGFAGPKFTKHLKAYSLIHTYYGKMDTIAILYVVQLALVAGGGCSWSKSMYGYLVSTLH